MGKEKIADKTKEKERIESDTIEEDLDRFIEKREIQNEALKKIVGIKEDPAEIKYKKSKGI